MLARGIVAMSSRQNYTVRRLDRLRQMTMIELCASVLPGRIAAWIDLRRPGLAVSFGGPMNGQQAREAAVRALCGAIPFAAVIETGTYRGGTTAFLRTLTDASIATIEISARYYHYARRRLASSPGVTVMRGSSPDRLRQLSAMAPFHASPAFFYLDAHWRADLPLVDELRIIAAGWTDYVILIDDFRVDDDPGYYYDDYGPGRARGGAAALAPGGACRRPACGRRRGASCVAGASRLMSPRGHARP